jgi:hypothetical protein
MLSGDEGVKVKSMIVSPQLKLGLHGSAYMLTLFKYRPKHC